MARYAVSASRRICGTTADRRTQTGASAASCCSLYQREATYVDRRPASGIFRLPPRSCSMRSGSATTQPAVYVDGSAQVTGPLAAQVDVVLGSDCAEDFDIAPAAEIEPGTVMVLDGNGALLPSEQGYDKKVAGMISGAGDCRPGLILGRSESPLKTDATRPGGQGLLQG